MTAAPLTDDPVLVAFAEEVGEAGAVTIAGARTRWQRGGALAASTRILHAPSGVVWHQPEEMTVCVRAGTPVAELASALADRGQRCALPERGGTVGGAIAVGENHLGVLGRGTVRASVLEVRYVSAEGRLVRGGGPTVKNVTGYDLPRVMTGSLGTLGLFAEFILRTNPLPAVTVWVRGEGADPVATRDCLRGAAVVLWDGGTTWACVEGHAADVRAQIASLAAIGRFDEISSAPPLPPYRWSLPPAAPETLLQQHAGYFMAEIGVGVLHASIAQPPRPVAQGVAAVAARLKASFDPTGRLNPGRDPGRP